MFASLKLLASEPPAEDHNHPDDEVCTCMDEEGEGAAIEGAAVEGEAIEGAVVEGVVAAEEECDEAVVEEEQELVDLQAKYREECRADNAGCCAYQEKIDQCVDRINSKVKSAETCSEELLDYLHCIDHCVYEKNFFQHLK